MAYTIRALGKRINHHHLHVTMESLIVQSIDWVEITTKEGNTQNSERYYIPVILQAIDTLGGKVGSKAGSQQRVDIRNVEWPDGTILSYDCKKVNKRHKFMFNDTFLNNDVWYIFIYVDMKKVRVAKGSTLIEESNKGEYSSHKHHLKKVGKIILDMMYDDVSPEKIKSFFSEVLYFLRSCVLNGLISYFDYGEMFKQTITFGSFSSRPRPNWFLLIPYKPVLQLEEEPRSPVVQSVPLEIQPIDSPVETPESV